MAQCRNCPTRRSGSPKSRSRLSAARSPRYHFLTGLARRANDEPTAAVAERIMAEEEGAALAVSATFERSLALTLGEPADPGTIAR
jgi:hypothetical protein